MFWAIFLPLVIVTVLSAGLLVLAKLLKQTDRQRPKRSRKEASAPEALLRISMRIQALTRVNQAFNIPTAYPSFKRIRVTLPSRRRLENYDPIRETRNGELSAVREAYDRVRNYQFYRAQYSKTVEAIYQRFPPLTEKATAEAAVMKKMAHSLPAPPSPFCTVIATYTTPKRRTTYERTFPLYLELLGLPYVPPQHDLGEAVLSTFASEISQKSKPTDTPSSKGAEPTAPTQTADAQNEDLAHCLFRVIDGVRYVSAPGQPDCKIDKVIGDLPGSLTIPSEIEFGDGAIRRLPCLPNGLFLGREDLVEIVLPPGMSVPEDCFNGCPGLRSFLGSPTSIGKRAFRGCEGLQCLDLGETLDEIEDEAFLGCNTLGEIRLPASIRKIGRSAFWLCDCLEIKTAKPLSEIETDPDFNPGGCAIAEETR